MRRSMLSAVLLALLGSVLAPAATYAATITVTTRADDLNGSPSCSLREAILAASTDTPVSGCVAGSTTGTDTINLPAGTYILSRVGAEEDDSATGDLDIHSTIKLVGAGSSSTIISGNRTDRVLHVLAPGQLTLEHVTITNGLVFDGPGGGIYNVGTLSIVHSVVRQNTADGLGGGLATVGTLTVRDSSIAENEASNGGGGGIMVNQSGSANVIRSTIAHNRALGGRGGGLAVFDGTATLTNTTVSGNLAPSEVAEYAGGVSAFSGTISLRDSTIAANVGGTGGVTGPVTLQGTIVAENVGERGAPDCLGTITSLGFNLIGSTTGCTLKGRNDGNHLNVDPNIGPLQQNGGPTATHALLPGSLAIDTAEGQCTTSDQRGIERPKDGTGDGKALCDIGAVERQSASRP
jgi:CSLREA domain-containing protein